MAVLNTTSPTVDPAAPMEIPRNTVPSSRARMAGCSKDTPTQRNLLILTDEWRERPSPRPNLIRRASGRERVGERIGSGRLAYDPAGGAQGAVGEGGATLGAMAEFQPLPCAGEEHRVLAHDVAGPHHRETDA